MQKIDDIRIGLQQLGAAVLEVNAIVEEMPGSWQILFEDGWAISLHYDEAKKTIELVAVLGAPDAGHELAVLRAMLCYQLLWRGRSQPRIALDAVLGSLICLCELDANLIGSAEFEERILNFWMQSAGLAEMVLEGTALSLPAAAPPQNMHLHA